MIIIEEQINAIKKAVPNRTAFQKCKLFFILLAPQHLQQFPKFRL